jgi:hypothetical protein
MKQSMKRAQLNSRLDVQTVEFTEKISKRCTPDLLNSSEVYEAILTRELLINDIQDSHSKYF